MLEASFLLEGAGDLKIFLDLELGVCYYTVWSKEPVVEEESSLLKDSMVVDSISVACIFKYALIVYIYI